MTGQRIGKWTVTSFAFIKHHCAYWNCLCDCGKLTTVAGINLRNGKSLQCNSCSGKISGPKSHVQKRNLYILQCEQYIKIGSTDNIELRLKSLNSANPFKLVLLRHIENCGCKEKETQLRFIHYRHKGEWFLFPNINELLEVIDSYGQESN